MSNRRLPFDPDKFNFAPVISYERDWHIFDFTNGYESDQIRQIKWGIGRYNEKRPGMYVAPQYEDRRNIHMGIDFWTPPGEPVYAFYDGEIAYLKDNARQGDYGPTIVTKHLLGGTQIYALYGHLNRHSLSQISQGQSIAKGEKIGSVGNSEENGGWEPHLHFQLAVEDPKKADMPGVVSEEDRKSALEKYPDPRLITGVVY